MGKQEAREKIRRLADELAKALTEGGENYFVHIERPMLPLRVEDLNVYRAYITASSSEEL